MNSCFLQHCGSVVFPCYPAVSVINGLGLSWFIRDLRFLLILLNFFVISVHTITSVRFLLNCILSTLFQLTLDLFVIGFILSL